MSDRKSQQDRILALLKSQEWVPLPDILDLRIANYRARISELRAQGHIIECATERSGRIRKSWYHLECEKWLKPAAPMKQSEMHFA